MRCIAVDWSGAEKPRKKIWLAATHAGAVNTLLHCPTREEAAAKILKEARSHEELVVGLDFAFSAPSWFLDLHGCGSAPELWTAAGAGASTWVEGPPFYSRGTWAESDFGQNDEFRRTERDFASAQPSSLFKLVGAKQVGKGSLTGMAALLRLRDAGFAVWPFDRVRFPLIVEIFPRLIYGDLVKSSCAARSGFLERVQFEPQELRDRAIDSDDAFDAAVSAWFMSRNGESFSRLRAVERPYSIEGKIWWPAASAAGDAIGVRVVDGML